MDLRQIEAFVAVAREGSVTRAARLLHLTQPGVSRQVQRLENELAVALFERGHGALRLTADGERVLRFAEAVLAAHQQLRHELAERSGEVAGTLRIAASTTPGEFLVPALLAQFVEQHPRVQPQVTIGDTEGVVERLCDRQCDLGFVGARMPTRELRYEAVAEDEIVLAAPASHPFATRGQIRLADLAGQPILEREGGSGTLRSVRELLAEHGLSLPEYRVVMVLSSSEAIVSAVERGLGLGWVSVQALQHRDTRRVAAVRLHERQLIRPLYLVHAPAQQVAPPASAFLAWVRHASAARQGLPHP